ncbi:LolA family protein [Jatrophihabitans sp. YIM 134969]
MPWTSLQTGWRTLVPLVVVGTVALVLAGAFTAGANSTPPPRTAASLLADLGRVDVAGYSGTVVQRSTLIDQAPSSASGLSLARLMSGSNTIKVWYGGVDRQRIAVLDAQGESDLFRDGNQVWQYDSQERVAIQSIANPRRVTDSARIPVDGTTVTPDDLARQAVAAVDPSTSVTVSTPGTVAGRPAYQLVITPPSTSATRIGRIVLWLDGDTRMPLAAQVYARGADDPSIDLAFTSIAFEVPDDEAFRFTPPAGVEAQTFDSVDADFAASPDPLLGLRSTVTVGRSWTRIAVITTPNLTPEAEDATTAQFGTRLQAVSGAWGSGQLLQTNGGLLSMLFLSDGRIVVGAVAPSALYAALG